MSKCYRTKLTDLKTLIHDARSLILSLSPGLMRWRCSTVRMCDPEIECNPLPLPLMSISWSL